MAIAEWIIYLVPISMGWPGMVNDEPEGHVARGPRAMIGGTSSRQTGWRDDLHTMKVFRRGGNKRWIHVKTTRH
jgi:hypothetical protein